MKYIFFFFPPEERLPENLGRPGRFQFQIWRPGPAKICPPGLPKPAFLVWWLFHLFGIFQNQDYGIITVYDDNFPVHYSGIFPKYFRFPFMEKNDLQVGDVWTHENYRNQGIATQALIEIVKANQKNGRRFWYITDEENKPSQKIAENAGFSIFGKGTRTKRFGIRLFGAFIVTDRHA